MNKNTVVRSRKGAKSHSKMPAWAEGYAQALDRLAEEFAGRGRTDRDEVAVSVAIGLLHLAALWRSRAAKTSLTITMEPRHA